MMLETPEEARDRFIADVLAFAACVALALVLWS